MQCKLNAFYKLHTTNMIQSFSGYLALIFAKLAEIFSTAVLSLKRFANPYNCTTLPKMRAK